MMVKNGDESHGRTQKKFAKKTHLRGRAGPVCWRKIPEQKKQLAALDLFLSPNLDLNVKRKGISRTKLLSGLEFVPLPNTSRTIAVIL